MGRSELNGIKACFRQVLDNRRDVPVFRDVVGHGAELEPVRSWLCCRLCRCLPNRKSGNDSNAGEEIASMHGGKITRIWCQLPATSCQLPAENHERQVRKPQRDSKTK